MLIAGTSPGVQYTGTFLGALGIYPCIANTISWVANNTEGVYKRGVTLGFVIGWGNLNGVVSSNIYQRKDSPLYRPGHGVVFAYLLLFLTGGSSLMTILLRRENAKRRAGGRDYLIEGKDEKEIEALGDVRYATYTCGDCLLVCMLIVRTDQIFITQCSQEGLLSTCYNTRVNLYRELMCTVC